MWIIQGTLAWRTSPVRTGVRSNVDLTFYSLVGSGRSGGTISDVLVLAIASASLMQSSILPRGYICREQTY
ncbi:hypothetical protein AHAS_Ahas18G0034600 [Arachis hypogaea]